MSSEKSQNNDILFLLHTKQCKYGLIVPYREVVRIGINNTVSDTIATDRFPYHLLDSTVTVTNAQRITAYNATGTEVLEWPGAQPFPVIEHPVDLMSLGAPLLRAFRKAEVPSERRLCRVPHLPLVFAVSFLSLRNPHLGCPTLRGFRRVGSALFPN